MTGRPLDSETTSSHIDQFRAVELNRWIGCLDDLSQGPLGVAEDIGVFRGHSVHEKVMPHLLDEMLELDVARMDEGDLEAVDVQVGAAFAGERSGRAVVVGVDVCHDEPPNPFCPEVRQGPIDGLDRFVGVHPAVEQVRLTAVRKDEDVDQPVLERDRQPNLTLLADANDWVKSMTGQMDATAAFMQGKLKIKGDMGLAIKMQSMFRRPN